jgi:Tol biopolymer transport system component
MIKKMLPIFAAIVLFSFAVSPLLQAEDVSQGKIRRLTHSGSSTVSYPCLSDDGSRMLYILEETDGEQTTRSVRLMNIDDGREKEIFRSGKDNGLPPYEEASLILGSKPPILSGNGKFALFSLSLGEPANILDHYLGIVDTDKSDFILLNFPLDALKGKDMKSLGFATHEWERVANYSISEDGERIACVVKGHIGPRKYGDPSGIVFIDNKTKEQRTILAPDMIDGEWKWTKTPRRPLSGGGWAFCMSGNGEKIVFGAQSSSEKTDYDLYITDWDAKEIKKLTDFHDRWFSQADVDQEGNKIIFYYTGKKKQGIGTYLILPQSNELKYLQTGSGVHVEFFDMSGNGKMLLFKEIYDGRMLELEMNKDVVIFDPQTPGYASGVFPMDFPRFPAFWMPKIVSLEADKVLLVGPPQGRETPEIYILERNNE